MPLARLTFSEESPWGTRGELMTGRDFSPTVLERLRRLKIPDVVVCQVSLRFDPTEVADRSDGVCGVSDDSSGC